MNDVEIEQALLKHFNVSERLKSIANVVRWDLYYGPSYVVAPDEDWSKWTENHHGDHTTYEELEEHGKPIETYNSPLANELRNYIDELPRTMYYDNQSGYVTDKEPEGEEVDGEWIEPDWNDWYMLKHRDIVKYLFGAVIAKEFW